MTTLLARGRRGERLDDCDIIDMHCHLGRAAHTVPSAEADGLLATMDRIGVRSAVCSHIRALSEQTRAGNDAMAEAIRAHPGRILGYVILWPEDRRTVADEVERCLAAGFSGIKMHSSNGFPYDDPAYEPAYAAAHERRLPVLYHTWGQASDFEQIGRVAARFPDARHLLGHAGSDNPDAYVAFAKAHASVVLELCFSRCPRGLVERLVAGAGPERIVWGSDATFLNQAQQIGKVLGADLPDQTKRMLLGANARRILERVRR